MIKNILITGGAGYIGSTLVTDLVNLKYNVTVIDNLSFSKTSLDHLFSNKNFKLIIGDTLNKNLLKKNLDKNEFIIPLAALVGAPLCDKRPEYAKKINLEIIKYICNIIKNNQKIIFPTTNSGYGIGQGSKFCDERTSLNPISLYGKTKSDAEKIILNRKNSICYRLATVFGYSYRMRTDLLVNNFVLKSLINKKIDLFEPHFVRNYIHVKDVSRAFIFAINNFNRLRSNTYNLGLSSANISKYELVKKIKLFNQELKININQSKKDPDKRNYYVSNKKIENVGFKTIYSLEDGILEMMNIFKKNLKQKFNNNY